MVTVLIGKLSVVIFCSVVLSSCDVIDRMPLPVVTSTFVLSSVQQCFVAVGRLLKHVLQSTDLTCVERLALCMIIRESTCQDQLSTWTASGSFQNIRRLILTHRESEKNTPLFHQL